MAVVWCREIPRERSQSGKYGETYTYTRAWLVRTDSPTTSLVDITNANGVPYLDPHPDDASCKALEFDTKPSDDTGLLYTVTVQYSAPPVNNSDAGGENPQPGSIAGIMKIPIWSAGSSVVTGPVYKDIDDEWITNSAGDPLEGLEKEFAEFRLTLKQYYYFDSQWAPLARQYTNAVNSDSWNGGAPRTWKCQGCSAQVITENSDGVTLVMWEVTWEFVYRPDTWDLKPWDIGFQEKADSSGVASATGDKRKVILGVDKKPVKQPVALASGVALPIGSPPEVINGGAGVEVYEKHPFTTVFGTLYTPPPI